MTILERSHRLFMLQQSGYRAVMPSRAVEVLEAGVWHHGLLRAWRRDEVRWEAFVDATISPGMTFVRWVTADQVRECVTAGSRTPGPG